VAGASTAIVAPESVFKRLALASVAGMLIIAASAQPGSPLWPTLVALGLMPQDSILRTLLICAVAGLGTQLVYFFGPSSAIVAVLAVLLAITGLLSASQPGLRSKTGWLVMIIIATGHLAVVLLVIYGELADRSLAPVIRWGETAWENIIAHVVGTAIFVSAFLAGRAAQRRYRKLVLDALEASRSVAIREALLEEARADYERALALQAVAEATTSEELPSVTPRTEAVTADPTTNEATPRPRPTVAVIDDGSHRRWSQALQSKLRIQDVYILAACLIGVYFTASMIKQPTPRIISLVAIIGIAVMIAARALVLYTRPGADVAWPYPVIATVSAGPAYGFGVHSGFAAIVATVLFTGRLFRTPVDKAHRTNVLAIYGVCISHTIVFVLIMTGVLPDESNLPLELPGLDPYTPYLHQAAVLGVYIAAYLAGGRVDREFVRAFEVSRDAYAESLRADTRLQVARTELDAALAKEGLFTGTALGSYQLGRLLGRGGMGEVYVADSDGKRVALKVLRADRLGDPVALERFEHEANLLMRIDSPYCARVIEVSSTAVPFLAMEFVDGPSLSSVLRDRGRLDTADLVALVDDLARGLGDVHAKGVVHLDLKPSNVLRDSSARWKIVDFGIARMLTGEAHRRVAGTPPYMAPEQALGEPIDTRTDLYSLSLILYRAITGRPAYTGTDAQVIANRARTLGPPDPRELVTIDEDLAIALRIGLAANINDRYASTTDLRNAFIGAFGGRLDPLVRNRGRTLLARAPWALGVPLISGPRSAQVSRSTR
jgi:predicted Ser/Thr protein kinase